MSSLTLALFALVAASAGLAQSDTPLANKHFSYTDLPYMVDTSDGPRGIQSGYNKCNSTTEGGSSMCQTATVNSLDDFCIWGPPKPDSSIADTEGELVAWCTKPGRGTRIIPPNALIGVQFMQTPDYLQVVGAINQTAINILHGDAGGEEDPHGADGRGNPLGSLVFTNGFPSNGGNNGSFQQVIEWHNFLGGDQFCFKICDPTGQHAPDYCQHIFDRIGCAFNAPADYASLPGKFEKCQGDNQDFPGVYTGSDGQVSTFTQPPESLGPIPSMPYTARVPKSSNCVSYKSEELFASAASVYGVTPSGSGAGASRTSGASGSQKTDGSHNGVATLVMNPRALFGVVAVAALML